MTRTTWKTREVARDHLKTSYHRLASLLRNDKIPPPAKDISGDYIWTEADIERARQALATDLRRKEHRNPPKESAVPA
jgi:hypothetical protein